LWSEKSKCIYSKTQGALLAFRVNALNNLSFSFLTSQARREGFIHLFS
jgi:hypothetical protein